MAESYLSTLIKNAKENTWPGTRPPWWLQLTGLGAAMIWGLKTQGVAFVSGEITSLLYFSVASLVFVNVTWFLWNLFLAPSRIDKERAIKIALLEAKLSNRANLEIKFGAVEPFYLQNGNSIHWNVGVLNTGPAVAENVGITLLSISPKPERVEQGILDCPMQLQRVSSADPLGSKINNNEMGQFCICQSIGPQNEGWSVSRFGRGATYSSVIKLNAGEQLELKYVVQAANATEAPFTLSMQARDTEFLVKMVNT
jgi:hypothetical protein